MTETTSETSTQLGWKEVLEEVTPHQGTWTEEQYLVLTDSRKRPVEYTDGYLEVLPWPTDRHQGILAGLLFKFDEFVEPRGGSVHFIGLRLRLRPGKFRLPDLLLLTSASDPRRQNEFWLGADLVVEIVSEDNPERDLVDKRRDYAEAQIPEYWIVNPMTQTITVLALRGETYQEAGVFKRGEAAVSTLLQGFSVSVAETFNAD
jgi:Uma2 family endonuclease